MSAHSPSAQLAAALEGKSVPVYAVRASISARQAANAFFARPVATVAFLRLCIALRHDPLPALAYAIPEIPSDFDFDFFAMAFRMRRMLHNHTTRQAAAVLGISAATICRLERGDAMFIGVTLRACEYIGQHAFAFLKIPHNPASKKNLLSVPRETLAAS